ncbi:uncharacterized protein LOC123558277 [Mercenaria mercenaria]|uniref:uncharacterized protein LOC123558277 n=1 Tax=Mercenaria mercenaria TaxID=6596 RepID=UPI00234EED65|nr:uncharacterized protein LOC123558277 [Mercenaria mercenaria]
MSKSRAAELLRQAADALLQDTTNSNMSNANAAASATSTAVTAATRTLFAPYRHPVTTRRRAQTDLAPSREQKHLLQKSGLGEKKITFVKNSDPTAFKLKLEESFPSLKNCGGFELLRSSPKSRLSLEVIEIPSGGYNTDFLSDCSGLFQALCYIRPIQQDIVLNEMSVKVADDGLLEVCLCCGGSFPLRQLREHTLECQGDTKVCVKVNFLSPRQRRRRY